MGSELDMTVVLVMGSCFALVLSVWCMAVLGYWMRRQVRTRELEHRLGLRELKIEEPKILSLWKDGEEATTVVSGERAHLGWLGRMARLPQEAGWSLPLASVLLGVLGACLLTFALSLSLGLGMVASIGLAVLPLAGTWMLARQQATRRGSAFERQFVDALQLVARSLKAGHPLVAAFQMASEELDDPVRRVFADICQQQELGRSVSEAIRSVSQSHTSVDLRIFATAVIIQLRSGGNLADMMGRLTHVIRERLRLARRMRVLTAQTQFSKRVLMVLPLLIFFLLNLLNPQYMELLYTTASGQAILAAAAVSMAVGSWVMNRMAVVAY